jgi:hypothetical protein
MSEKDRGNENLNKRFFPGVGKYEIPKILPCESYTTETFISFNNAMTEKNPKRKGVHFFLDDYQFQRVWDFPTKYIELFKSFDCVFSPDFSLYADYPLSLQIYNHYRKMWLSRYYQEYGVNIVPVACWSDDRSFEFCFDGMPVDSIIAIANTGAVHGDYSKALFKDGFEKMLDVLRPKTILFYGQVQDFISDCGVPVVHIGESHDRFLDMFCSYTENLSEDEKEEFKQFLEED